MPKRRMTVARIAQINRWQRAGARSRKRKLGWGSLTRTKAQQLRSYGKKTTAERKSDYANSPKPMQYGYDPYPPQLSATWRR